MKPEERFTPKSEAHRSAMVQKTISLPHVEVGHYRICEMGSGRDGVRKIWIQSFAGEGMECDAEQFEEAVRAFFNENF